MPGSTPVFGIRYPLLGETIDPAAFSNEAADINNVLATLNSLATRRLTRPYVNVFGFTGNVITVAVDTTISFTTENVDTDNIFSLGSPTNFVIQTAGYYLTSCNISGIFNTTTTTAQKISIHLNGVRWWADRRQTLNLFLKQTVTGFLYCNVGDIITFRVQWNGTGGPGSVSMRAYAIMVCDP